MIAQCSSTKNSSATNQNTSAATAPVVMHGRPEFYRGRDSTATGNHPDSASQNQKAEFSSPRVLHIATHGSSIYDTHYDSARHNSIHRKSTPHPLLKATDSTKYNYDIDVGILTVEEAMSLSLKLSEAEIVTLSLVDPALYEAFEKENIEKKFAHYGAQYILFTVSKTDSKQRRAFVIRFYQERLSGKTTEGAFQNALEDARRDSDVIDFKARLIKNR